MSKLPLRPNVCMLLFNSEGKLFLGERLGEPGIWQFPQGGVEPDSTLEENALREIQEETGISRNRLRIFRRLNAVNEYEWESPPAYASGKWRGQSQTFWLVEFLGADNDVKLAASQHPEFMSWRWCSASEVRRIAEPKRLKGYEAALCEFEALRQRPRIK